MNHSFDNVRLYGTKPYKAAVIHGGPGALGTVAAIARQLAKDYGVIEPLQTQNSISELLIELDGILAANCEEPVILIGHSWGAWLALMYAAEYPDKTKQVIMIGSGPLEVKYVADIDKNRKKHLTDSERVEYCSLLAGLGSNRTQEKDALMKRLGQLVEKTDNYCPFAIDTDETDILPVRGDAYSAIWNEAESLRADGRLLKLAEKLKCPVTMIHGDHDPHPFDGVRLPLEKRIGHCNAYLLEKCGHEPWKEKYAYQRFYEIIRQIIEDNP
ncbi:MAG TPA: alpha/beta hydrolase [Bacillota bacterium]|nr:alpha/beta hydrolase [Bacillota bacterium]